MRAVEKIGVRTSSSTSIKITATVLCPSNEARPSPMMNPMAASSSSHKPAFTMSESGGERNSLA